MPKTPFVLPSPAPPDTSLGFVGWTFIGLTAIVTGGFPLACTKAQGVAIESALTKASCALVAVLSHDEQVGTLCDDIAPAVEAEIAAIVAEGQPPSPEDRSLIGHRSRRRMRRLATVAPGRDPGETVEDGAPLEATMRVLARRGVAK